MITINECKLIWRDEWKSRWLDDWTIETPIKTLKKRRNRINRKTKWNNKEMEQLHFMKRNSRVFCTCITAVVLSVVSKAQISVKLLLCEMHGVCWHWKRVRLSWCCIYEHFHRLRSREISRRAGGAPSKMEWSELCVLTSTHWGWLEETG